MANKRIKDLSTTAAVTASDDFIAVDGATNGTRKLDAYSPTFGGNLTVSGNGLNTFGGTGTTNASILFGASNVANTSAGYLSISQRSNYGYALFGWNMTGTSGSDAYTSPKNATGSAGVELIGGSSGITRFIYSTAVTTAGSTLTVTEAARFSSGNFLLGTTTDGGQKLQVAGTASISGDVNASNSIGITTGNITEIATNGTATLYVNYNGYQQSNTQFRNFGIYDGKRAEIAMFTGSTKAVALAGNLTVSGGQIALDASSSTPSVLVTQTDPAAYSLFRLRNTGGTAQSYDFAVGGSGTGSLAQKFYVYDGTAGAVRLAIAPTTGNLLLGTTTDSGNGRFQLATHTTSAGGIGFGTDVSLYRNAANQVSFIGGGAAPIGFALSSGNPYIFGGASGSFIRFNSTGQLDLVTATATSLTLQTNYTTALTLDSSQNATFAGKVLTASGTAAAPTLTFSGDSDTGFYTPGGNQVAATANGTQIWNTTSNGLAMASGKDIYVGNAYVAGAPTATGYIVIKDSTGTSYKIPAVAL